MAARSPLARGSARSRALTASLGANLTLNAAWNWMFFGLHSPRAGLAGTVLLDISNAELIRRTARIDPGAAQALVPYALWCAFATALNADIARRNGTSPLTSPQSHPARRPLRPARGNCG
jgi:tryptophan-rich sensory protein